MDSVGAVTARISEIQSQFAWLTTGGVGGVLGGIPAPAASGTAASSGATLASAPGSVFADTLAKVSGAGPAGVAGGKDRLGADKVPEDLRRYGNGKVPASALSPVDGTNKTLWEPAARSLEALRKAAAADGVKIGVTDGYRTYETQVDLVRRKGLYSQGGLAAAPGTSNHGWGMAADLALDANALAWMRTNAGDYGFVEDTPRESWHWGYHPTH